MVCIKEKDYALGGDKYSENYRFLEIILRKCSGI
jgi:hypothetical protein